MNLEIIVIIGIYLFYYIMIFLDQKRIITEPKEIIMKFLAVVFLYAGISLIYFSVIGKPLFTDNPESYNVYIFIIGFIAVLWTVPFLLNDFKFFRKLFVRGASEIRLKSKRDSKSTQTKSKK
jgi:hypothetical protein